MKTEIFLVTAISFWIAVNLPPWRMYGTSIALMVLNEGTTRMLTMNHIFPFTYGLSIFTFIFSFVRFRRNLKFGVFKSLSFAMTTPFAFVATFEGVYQNIFYFVAPNEFHTSIPYELLLASWLLLGFASCFFWKPSLKFYLLLLLDIAGFMLWCLIGYPQINAGGLFGLYALILNIITKVSFALTFLALIYNGTRRLTQLVAFSSLENKAFLLFRIMIPKTIEKHKAVI